MTKPTFTSDLDRVVAPTTTAELKSIFRLHVKDTTWISGASIVHRKLDSVEDRYWSKAATERLENPKWVSEAEFWSRFGPAS